MANTRSARKRIRANEAKHVRNKAVRSAVRTSVLKARKTLLSGETGDVQAELKAAVSALDRAAEKGILHRNNAIRRKSRLTAMAAKLLGASSGEHATLRAAAGGGEKGRSKKAGTTAVKAKTSKTAKAAAAKTAVTKTVRTAAATSKTAKPVAKTPEAKPAAPSAKAKKKA